jgi:hypothetical protein
MRPLSIRFPSLVPPEEPLHRVENVVDEHSKPGPIRPSSAVRRSDSTLDAGHEPPSDRAQLALPRKLGARALGKAVQSRVLPPDASESRATSTSDGVPALVLEPRVRLAGGARGCEAKPPSLVSC